MDMEEQRDRGRPTIYTYELRAEFCRRLSGGRTKRSVCRDDDMPDRDTIERWLRDLPNEENKEKAWIIDDFYGHYTRARTIQADNIHDECIDIADDGTNDFVEIAKKQKDGSVRTTVIFDKEHVNRSRLRVDARLAWLQNTEPRVYGKNRVEVQALDKKGEPADQAMSCAAWMDQAKAEIEAEKAKDGKV